MKITVIGNAIVDVLAGPVDEGVLQVSSTPVEKITTSFGGDALNEAVVLSKLGKDIEIITKVGNDDAGKRVVNRLKECGISTLKVKVDDSVETSVNIVLVDQTGERHFITNPNGSQRKLELGDVMEGLDEIGDIVSYASIFVSSSMSVEDTAKLFKAIKSKGVTLTADMTKAKKGEKIDDIKDALLYVDYLFPNKEEISLLTGIEDPMENARTLMNLGVKHPVIKCGSEGCVVGVEKDNIINVPAYPVDNCVDTTGAGDCFVAGFLYALSEGYSILKCARFANATASFAIRTLGATNGIKDLEQVNMIYLQ